MNLEIVANYADVIGGITVIVSLIYVGVQGRHNTLINRGIAAEHTVASTETIYSWHAENSGASDRHATFHQMATF